MGIWDLGGFAHSTMVLHTWGIPDVFKFRRGAGHTDTLNHRGWNRPGTDTDIEAGIWPVLQYRLGWPVPILAGTGIEVYANEK